MKRYILTTYTFSGPRSRAFVDDTAAVKEWMEFSDRPDEDYADWLDVFKVSGHMSYFNDSDYKYAFLTTLEIY